MELGGQSYGGCLRTRHGPRISEAGEAMSSKMAEALTHWSGVSLARSRIILVGGYFCGKSRITKRSCGEPDPVGTWCAASGLGFRLRTRGSASLPLNFFTASRRETPQCESLRRFHGVGWQIRKLEVPQPRAVSVKPPSPFFKRDFRCPIFLLIAIPICPRIQRQRRPATWLASTEPESFMESVLSKLNSDGGSSATSEFRNPCSH